MTSSVRKLSSRISNYIKPLPVQTNGLTQTGVILVYFKELFIGNPAGRVSTIYDLIESHFAACFNLAKQAFPSKISPEQPWEIHLVVYKNFPGVFPVAICGEQHPLFRLWNGLKEPRKPLNHNVYFPTCAKSPGNSVKWSNAFACRCVKIKSTNKPTALIKAI